MKKLFRLPVSGSAKTFLECRIMLILQNYIFLTVEDESIPSASGRAMMKENAAPRHSSSTTGGNTICASRWQEFSTPMARICIRTMDGLSRTSSSRPCRINPSQFMAMACRHGLSVMLMT